MWATLEIEVMHVKASLNLTADAGCESLRRFVCLTFRRDLC